MARKSKTCDKTKLEQTPSLVIRKCLLGRGHDGDQHTDERGNWRSAS